MFNNTPRSFVESDRLVKGIYDQENHAPQFEEDEVIAPPELSEFERKKRREMLRSKIISYIALFIGIVLLFLCSSGIYQYAFNKENYTGFFNIGAAVVASGSMEPKLSVNDLVFYKQATLDDIVVGDTIVYKKMNSSGETVLIIHQVEQISNGYITTKGIANQTMDEPFPASDVVGKYMWGIPLIGGLLAVVNTIWAPLIIFMILLSTTVIRICIYQNKKKKIINEIASSQANRSAINDFFDI